MELEELKSSWNALNERANKLEGENKRLAREALGLRIKSTRAAFIRRNLLKVGSVVILLFLLNGIITNHYPSTLGDWSVRAVGIFAIYMIVTVTYNTRLLSRINIFKYPPKTVLENMCRFRISMRWTYIFNFILVTGIATVMFAYFHSINSEIFYGAVIGLIIGLALAAFIMLRRIVKDMKDLKSEIKELEEI